MTSYEQRFLAGEHRAVWDELGRLRVVPADLGHDVAAVARETMRRVARHVNRIADALGRLDFVLSNPRIPVHDAPGEADRAKVELLEVEIGGLPYAFAACLREVGGVSFLGDCPQLALYYNEDHPVPADMPPGFGYPDPLVLPPVSHLRYEWDEHRDVPDSEDLDRDFVFAFAPDELHKANISGSTHDLVLPDRAADPVLYGIFGRQGVTLVEYLRLSIGWAGFPGWSFVPDQVPAALAGLRVEPDF